MIFFRFQEICLILLSLVATTVLTGDISGKHPQNLSHPRDSPCYDRVTSSPPELGGEPVRAGWSEWRNGVRHLCAHGYFDGKPYRVMTLMKEYAQPDMNLREYAYDVAKIEVLDDMPNTSNGAGKADKGLYPLAKLLKDVGKAYEKDKKQLGESQKLTDVDKYCIGEDKKSTINTSDPMVAISQAAEKFRKEKVSDTL